MGRQVLLRNLPDVKKKKKIMRTVIKFKCLKILIGLLKLENLLNLQLNLNFCLVPIAFGIM